MTLASILTWFRGLSSTGRLMCGVPDYDAYCRHLADTSFWELEYSRRPSGTAGIGNDPEDIP